MAVWLIMLLNRERDGSKKRWNYEIVDTSQSSPLKYFFNADDLCQKAISDKEKVFSRTHKAEFGNCELFSVSLGAWKGILHKQAQTIIFTPDVNQVFALKCWDFWQHFVIQYWELRCLAKLLCLVGVTTETLRRALDGNQTLSFAVKLVS